MKIKKLFLSVSIFIIALNFVFAVGCNSNVDGVKWYHISAEKKALYYQAYNIASEKIEGKVKKNKYKKGSWGIILDIDETVLDNSWAEYDDYKNYKFSESIYEKAKGVATPGAVEFTHFIHSLGGYVSLVTNRVGNNKQRRKATIDNLKKQNIYYDQVLFSNEKVKDSHNKNPRFKAVESGKYSKDIIVINKLPAHHVVAYFGDNIQDFPNLKQEKMQKASQQAYKKFGSKYFIMPNPMYGSWM